MGGVDDPSRPSLPAPGEPSTAGGAPALGVVLERLDALVDWERRDRTAAMRQELGPTRDLLDRLGAPQSAFRAVHVTGTKGKGSVCALVAAGLAAAGLRVGRYLSPHVERMNERVAIDGVDVDDARLARALGRALDAREAACRADSPGRDATWFDVVTAAAFALFAEAGVDWAAVEVGLGGRLDSTNVLDAPVCVLTNVDLEHTAVLGSTRAAIAREKAAIAKAGAVLVTGVPPPPDEAGVELERRAADVGARIVRPAVRAADLRERNVALARLALDELGRSGVGGPAGPVSGALLDGAAVAAAALPGRLERREVEGVPLVLDGAHVPASVAEVLDLCAAGGPPGRPVVILSLRADKDRAGVLKALVGRVDRVLCTSAEAGLHVIPTDLQQEAKELGLAAETAVDPGAALGRARILAREGAAWILATGSLYLVGALRKLLGTTRSA